MNKVDDKLKLLDKYTLSESIDAPESLKSRSKSLTVSPCKKKPRGIAPITALSTALACAVCAIVLPIALQSKDGVGDAQGFPPGPSSSDTPSIDDGPSSSDTPSIDDGPSSSDTPSTDDGPVVADTTVDTLVSIFHTALPDYPCASSSANVYYEDGEALYATMKFENTDREYLTVTVVFASDYTWIDAFMYDNLRYTGQTPYFDYAYDYNDYFHYAQATYTYAAYDYYLYYVSFSPERITNIVNRTLERNPVREYLL